MRYLLIDCDPGHDDALAILMAFAHPEYFNILGITTIGGNQVLEKVTTNARNLLSFIGANIPLAKGQSKPLIKPLMTGADAHGVTGMDGPSFPKSNYPIVSDQATVFMYKQIMACPQKVTLVGIGPLTNIALLLKTFPDVKDKIDVISIMGGGISHGNCTEVAEFNIYVDPEAAYIVFHSGVPIVMSGLDVTEKACITEKEINSLKNRGKVQHMVYELLSFYHESGKQFGFVDSPLHDLCAIQYLYDPLIFSGKKCYVDIVTEEGSARGQTFADLRQLPKHKNNAYVLMDVKREDFVKNLLEGLECIDGKA